MAEAKFLLKEPANKEATLIYLFYRYNGNVLKYSTGEKIKPQFWNKQKQRAKLTIQYAHGERLNEILDSLAREVVDKHKELITSRVAPTPAKLKAALDALLFKQQAESTKRMVTFAEKLMKEANRGAGTLRQWKQTIGKINEFERYSNTVVEFDSINIDFYESFVKHLTQKGYAKNTIGGHVKNIKIFMGEALARNLTTNIEYKNKKFRVLDEQVEKIYLSERELSQIYNLDLSQQPRLARVRDLFIIACYTGLRFSDLVSITKENLINNATHLRIKTQKTGEIIQLPLQRYVREIFAKYDWKLPAPISNQKMNDYLKEIASKANITAQISIGSTKGGQLKTQTFLKSELVCTHTARRSFATNAYLREVPSISIMKITGHRTEKSFMKYIKITQEENANKLTNHPFFN